MEHTNEFYQKILGFAAPWEVIGVDLSESPKMVTVRIEAVARWVWHDDERGGRGHRHGGEERSWRHLDTCGYETRLVAKVPRIKWPDGSTSTPEVPWAQRFTRFTRAFEAHVIETLLEARSHSAAQRLLGMSRSCLHLVMERAVQRGLLRRQEEVTAYLGLDEKAYRRAHRYASILTDIEGGRVIDLVEGRGLEASMVLLNQLSMRQKSGVKAVAMDMWENYIRAVHFSLPAAEVVHDRFHVSQHLGQAVDVIRRRENRQLVASGDNSLKGSKYRWLRARPDGRTRSGREFAELCEQVGATCEAWGLKELFGKYWQYRRPSAAAQFFNRWLELARQSALAPILRVADMLERHWRGIISYHRHRITNAAAEGINSVIQTIRANARGLPDFQRLRTRVLFHCGRLQLNP